MNFGRLPNKERNVLSNGKLFFRKVLRKCPLLLKKETQFSGKTKKMGRTSF